MEKYEIRCTESQTRKALELGAPLYKLSMSVEDSHLRDKSIRVNTDEELIDYAIPTAEEMIGWLEDQGIMININYQLDGYCSISVITEKETIKTDIEGSIYRKIAIIASIDAALEYLISKKK